MVVLSAVGCFMRRNLTRIHDYFMQTLPRYLPDQFKHHFRMMRVTCELFSREIMQTGQIPTGNSSERPVLVPEKQILAFSWRIGNQEPAWTVADRFASSAVSTGRHLVALVDATFTAEGTRADSCWVEMPNGTENFQKKGQPQEVDRNFQNKFPETFCSIRF